MTHSFTARSGENVLKLDLVLENDQPVKLGDGTFGCVFHARDKANRNFAIKVFYESTDDFIKISQQEEVEIGDKLRFHFRDDIDRANSVERFLVIAQGHVTKFKSSPAYKSLKTYFERQSFNISNSAIIMDLYPMSLKDLLERGWPTNSNSNNVKPSATLVDDSKIGRGSGGSFGDTPGYAVLRELSQGEREKCILPFVRDIAESLALLHDASYNHQDIKPANVLVRINGTDVEAALADLGFINTGMYQAHGSDYRNQPLGTRHYRSPEQTDYFDICEVDIAKRKKEGYELTTHDPKFRNTFSEPKDFVVFAKLDKPIQWEIENIKFKNRDDDSVDVQIFIKDIANIDLQEDKRTQISIHKRQTARTDLFGLGAITYDMVTCGRSPEQFYDLLRAHDRREETIDKDLVQRYIHFKNGGGTIPEIDAIFQNLRVNSSSEFPHSKLVAIILKCMMSRPEDSYFRQGAWDKAKDDIENLTRELSGYEYKKSYCNYLTNGSRDIEPPKTSSISPIEELRKIQLLSYSTPEECINRLVLGVRFLARIAKMVEKELKSGTGFLYLANISPTGLQESRGDLSPQFALFEKKQDLEAALASGSPKSILQSFSAGNLLPPFMNALVRECEIWVNHTSPSKKEQNLKINYDLWGPDFGWPGVNVGDRLICEFSATSRINSEITSVKEGCLFISIPSELNLERLNPNFRHRAVVFKKFHPSDYYVAMLGIYIRLIFFVNPDNRHENVPQAIYCLEQGRSVGLFGDTVEKTQLKSISILEKLKLKNSGTLDGLFLDLAETYVRLITRQIGEPSKNQFSLERLRDPALIINRIVKKLNTKIANLLVCDESELVNTQQLHELIKDIKSRDTNFSAEKFPSIDDLTIRVVANLRQ